MSGDITVLGGTGNIGRALLSELADLGHRAVALVRPGRGPAVAELAAPVEVEMEAEGGEEAFVRALRGRAALFLLTPFHPRQDLIQERLARAAADAGVAHVVKLSALGADPDSPVLVHRQHGLAERTLAELGLAYTSLRPNAFMQNAVQWLPTLASQDAVVLPAGRARVSMVDVRDIAAAAAALLTGPPPPGKGGEVYELTGPEALGYADVAAALSAATGREIRYLDVPPARAAEAMRSNGVPEWAVEARLQLYATYVAGEAETVTGAVRELTGREPRSFSAFAAELAPRLKEGRR
ncbi:NmrA family NAD(P)-binding protein [Streptomyces sp. ISL-36]|uniref:NmrA family NAD(P)-binding protein n=1 Tax=Streptomyces sp. ISL-36 TaxID=2819182 RepID=UPI001BE659A4|nr:NmrA family NAD(P)-binding protein [Streptomyces sp. ISL-36]MBT2440133.1 NmrA family NAD(P)-binding protein [Streptomyces sp. ISL-36]